QFGVYDKQKIRPYQRRDGGRKVFRRVWRGWWIGPNGKLHTHDEERKADALAWVRDRAAEVHVGVFVDANSATVGDMIRVWVKDAKDRERIGDHMSRENLKAIERYARRLNKDFGPLPGTTVDAV